MWHVGYEGTRERGHKRVNEGLGPNRDRETFEDRVLVLCRVGKHEEFLGVSMYVACGVWCVVCVW